MDRSINPHEADVIRWLLDKASVCDVAAFRPDETEGLRVFGDCLCGCSSLEFKPEGQRANAHMLADALAIYPDGQVAGLILWGRAGEIVSLEVYDLHPEASRRFPEKTNLCTWEEWGRQNSK